MNNSNLPRLNQQHAAIAENYKREYSSMNKTFEISVKK